MEEESMKMSSERKPEIVVFAGPNGSGKSTFTEIVNKVGVYITADDIKRVLNCTDLEAAELADDMRMACVEQGKDFMFETVLSTPKKLEFLSYAKSNGYFIKGFFILTADPAINVMRVKSRARSGGHDVPKEKIISRYEKAMKNLPKFIEICDVCHVYDNTIEPFRIYKKRITEYFIWENEIWSKERIHTLVTDAEQL